MLSGIRLEKDCHSLNRVVREGLIEKLVFVKDIKEIKEQTMKNRSGVKYSKQRIEVQKP